jgi:alpha-tubulin suppressor-like RCC1 family protein
MKKINTNRIFSIFILGVIVILLNSCFDIELEEPPPVPVDDTNDYVAIAAGYNHTLALIDKQYAVETTLWAWGTNMFGQLGDSTTVSKDKPVYIGSGYSRIEAGGAYSFGLKEEELHFVGLPYYINHLWAWGDNQFGQLGCGPLPKFTNTARPIGRN